MARKDKNIYDKKRAKHTELKREDFKGGIVGYAKDMKPEDIEGKVVDSMSGLVFKDKKAYREHVSPVTGKRADSNDHMPSYFHLISEKALARGAAKKAKKDKEKKVK